MAHAARVPSGVSTRARIKAEEEGDSQEPSASPADRVPSAQAVASLTGHGTPICSHVSRIVISSSMFSEICGTIADESIDLLEIGNAAPHVFERAAVDLLVRDELDLGLAVAHRFDPLGQLEDGDFFVAADVEHLAFGFTRIGKQQNAADDVAHGREAARLLAVAEHENRLVPQGADDHVRDHHAVRAGLARAHRC